MKPRRFFYHYFRGKRAMSVHFMGTCYVVNHIQCDVPCETKWNKRQPYLVMRGYAHGVDIKDGTARIW
jgi:hypothetical protein